MRINCLTNLLPLHFTVVNYFHSGLHRIMIVVKLNVLTIRIFDFVKEVNLLLLILLHIKFIPRYNLYCAGIKIRLIFKIYFLSRTNITNDLFILNSKNHNL